MKAKKLSIPRMIYQILIQRVLARQARRRSHTSPTSIDNKKTQLSNPMKRAQSRPLIGEIKVKMTNSKTCEERYMVKSLTTCLKAHNSSKMLEVTHRALFNPEHRASMPSLPGSRTATLLIRALTLWVLLRMKVILEPKPCTTIRLSPT